MSAPSWLSTPGTGPDTTLAELELVGEGAASGANFVGTVHQVVRWRDGLTAEVISFPDRDSALSSAR